MRARCSQINVAHAFTTHFLQRNFNTTFFADNATIFRLFSTSWLRICIGRSDTAATLTRIEQTNAIENTTSSAFCGLSLFTTAPLIDAFAF